jgi:hypothetical protein
MAQSPRKRPFSDFQAVFERRWDQISTATDGQGFGPRGTESISSQNKVGSGVEVDMPGV